MQAETFMISTRIAESTSYTLNRYTINSPISTS